MERIIVTPLMGVGDTLMTTPALQVLKRSRPDCEVTFFTFSTGTRDILLNNPDIDHLWYFPIKAIHFAQATMHVLTHFFLRFDTCINFYPSNRIQYNGFALMTGARKRIGHTYLHQNFSQLNWLKNRTIPEEDTIHCVEENVRLLQFLNITVDTTAIPPMHIYLTDREKALGGSFRQSLNAATVVGIHAGTSTFKNHAYRRWPREYFVELIDLHPDIHFVLFGALDEIEINQFIKTNVTGKDRVSIVTDKTIREVASLIGACDAFISNDSGLMHIAAAMETPVVEILGPTNQNFIYPWGVKHAVVRLDLPCSPCFYYSPRPLSCRLNNSYACLRDLKASQVSEALNELLYC